MLRKTTVGGSTDGCVGTPSPAGKNGHAPAIELLLALILVDAFLLGELGLGLDVDPPAREPRGQSRILTVAADGERELVVRDDHDRLHLLVVDYDLSNPGRRKRLGHEPRGLLVVRNDVDLLAPEL